METIWQPRGGELDITSIDSNGNLKGTSFGNPIDGFYHSASGQIHFSRMMGIDRFQVYNGHKSIIRIDANAPYFLFAGSYVKFTSGFGTRPPLGCYASRVK